MSNHLDHDKNATVSNTSGNTRNGKSQKTLKGEFGELPIEIPPDREGSVELQLISKHQTRRTGFDDKIISLYSRCMTLGRFKAILSTCTAEPKFNWRDVLMNLVHPLRHLPLYFTF